MKKSFLATASWLVLASSAAAQDNAPVVWQGLYVGVSGGIASHDASVRAINGSTLATDAGDLSAIGGIVGGHAGYNFQLQHLVFGVEADASWVDGDESGTTDAGSLFSTDLDWLVTIRGRAGVALSPTLIYVTGGLAVGEVENNLPNQFGGFPTDSDTRTGFVFGGGVEHMFSPRVLVRGEILHVDLGDNTVVGFSGPGYNARFENQVTLGRVGVSLKW